MSQNGLNCLFLKRLWLVLVTMSRPPSLAFVILLLIIPASVAEQVAIYYMGLVPSGFYEVLENRDSAGFYRQLWVASWWVLAIVLIKSSKSYAAGALYIQWRWNLTETLHYRYFAHRLFYNLNCLNNGIDNPDMRMTQDVDKLTDTLQTIILQVVVFPGIVLYYTYKCWSTMGYLGPVCIYSYFIVSCICNKLLMSPIVAEVFRLERKEGHFRFIHVNLRNSAESAAFSNAETVENKHFQATLRSILQSKQRIVNRQMFLNLAINTCDYVGAILSYMILAIPIFAGVYDHLDHLGTVISQNSFVAMYLVYSFSSMVDLSGKIADLAGYTHRVGELLEFMRSYGEDLVVKNRGNGKGDEEGVLEANLYYDSKSTGGEEKKHEETNMTEQKTPEEENEKKQKTPEEGRSEDTKHLLRLTGVTVLNPINNKPLVKDLYFSLNHHTNVLIHGPPGAGKSSVLRTIKALWEPLAGSIESTGDIMFLPQRPYFSRQSLRAQLTLPDTPVTADDTVLMGILKKLNLTSILQDTVFMEPETVKENKLRRLLRRRNKPSKDSANSAQEPSPPNAKSDNNFAEDYHIRESRAPSLLDRLPQRDWYKSLSPGKQQLLAFARVLYHKPQIVVMDEATSAVSGEYASLIYSALQEMGACYLSVSHDVSLEKYHDKVIEIAGDGERWSEREAAVTSECSL